MFFVYLIESLKKNGEIYIGSTSDLIRRIKEHNDKIVKSTKRYSPWRLVSYEAYRSEQDARIRESKLKNHGNAMKEFKNRSRHSFKNSAGFTLIELLIVLVIVVTMSLVILSDLPAINETQVLDLTAQDLALTIREAQFYGLSGVEGMEDSENDFGIYLEDTDPPYEIILFADIDRNTQYETGTDLLIDIFSLSDTNIEIDRIGCAGEGFPSEIECESFTIIFKRVRSDAFIYADIVGGGQFSPGSEKEPEYISIELTDPAGHMKKVKIWSSGIVNVE